MIKSKFYLIRGDGVPIYVGFTNRSIKQRFSEHKADKDFNDYDKVKIEKLDELDYEFTWDENILYKNANEVSAREAQLILEYGTQDSSYQKAIGGGQVWTYEKWFVKSNKNNPKFTGMSDNEIQSYIQSERGIELFMTLFVSNIQSPIEIYMSNFVSNMKDPVDVFMGNLVNSMYDPTEVFMRDFVNHMKDPVDVFMGNFASHMDDPVELFLRDFVMGMVDPVEQFMGNFVKHMLDPVDVFMRSFVVVMKDPIEVFMSNFVTRMIKREKYNDRY